MNDSATATASTDLAPGLGLAICDNVWTTAIVSPSTIRRSVPRFAAGAIFPGESLADVVKRVLPRAGFPTDVVGISHHDADAVDTIDAPEGVRIVQVSPTVATLMGSGSVSDRRRTVIRHGFPKGISPDALLKIGPKWVSFALEGDKRTHRYIEPADVANFGSQARDFTGFVSGRFPDDSVELLGNRGWRNAADYFAQLNGSDGPKPDGITASYLQNPNRDWTTNRKVTSRLCSQAMVGDLFAKQVATFMAELLGGAIAYVASQHNVSNLLVQANSISAVNHMPDWMIRTGGLLTHLPAGDLAIELIGPRPQEAESLGAVQVASQLALA